MNFKPLPQSFYDRYTPDVAQELLGKVLVRRYKDQLIAGIIIETESYTDDDPASHAYRGLTQSNRALFGPVGHAYIYFTYGCHFCFNAAAFDSTQHKAGGVLIRAVQPVLGIDLMQAHRKKEALKDLASGPGKLTQAFVIDKELYGANLAEPGKLFIAEGPSIESMQIKSTPRIGISKAKDVLWRFYLKEPISIR